MTEKTLTEEDATAIVNAAIDLDGRSEDRLTVAELEDRVEALGVPRTRIREVLLSRARQAKEAENRAREARERAAATAAKIRRVAGLVGLVASGVVFLFVFSVACVLVDLDGRLNGANAAQERVYAALGRQQATLSMVQGYTDPLNRDAEVAGAANRVYVARVNYDRLVSAYNSEASILYWFLRRSRILPVSIPLAREVWR